MRLSQLFSVLLISVSSLTSVCAQASERAVTVHAWPLDSSEPHQLAKITYNPTALSSTISQLTLPKKPYRLEELVRVGLYDPNTADWRGIVTSAASFDPNYQQKISLHVDEDGLAWHVGFSAHPKPSAALEKVHGEAVDSKATPQVVVEIVKSTPGPQPVLNRPVVLNAEGKIQEKEPEKTLLQKYWWIIGIVLLMQIMAAGGSETK